MPPKGEPPSGAPSSHLAGPASSESTRARFVVTGCGRSGTGYVSQLLSALGVPCGHEAIYGPTGPGGWGGLLGDSSWLAVPYLDEFDGTVIHLVRDPRKVVESHLRIQFFADHHRTSYQQALRRAAPEVFHPGGQFERACRYWVLWNGIVERHTDQRIPVEGLDPANLLGALGASALAEDQALIQRVLAAVPTTYNSRQGRTAPNVGWDELPGDVRALALKYGYLG